MDWDLWCRLAAHGARFSYLKDALAAVRYYPETKTLSGGRRRYSEIWRIGRKYGRRVIPVSWLGFYRFDLSFKQKKTPGEHMIFMGLDLLRHLKKRVLRQTQGTIYGFRRWRSVVDGRCLIQFPCYSEIRPQNLLISVDPPDGCYRITAGSDVIDRLRPFDGKLRINLPPRPQPLCRVQIECLDRQQWELLNCSF
jgi:hypothetical protein